MGPILEEALMGFADYFRATTSKLAETTASLLLDLVGNVDGDDNEETVNDQEHWGHPAICYRPADSTSDGELEVIGLRRGEDVIALGARDVRWQPDDLEKGEVLVRGFGENAATVLLKPDGTVVVTAASDILLGSSTAAKALALAETVDSNFQQLKTAYETHVHGGVTTGGGSTGTTTPLGSFTGTGSTKVKASE